MGKNTDKLYITHDEHASGLHSASSTGKQFVATKSIIQRLPFDCCALSLQPFTNPVAVISEATPTNPTPRADVFELMNIVPYIRKFKTSPVTAEPLDTSQLIKLNFFKNAEGNMHDPITYKVFSPHVHIVFLRNTGNVFDMASLQLLAIKSKTWRDLIDETPFTRKDIITIQDPENLAARDMREYDYIKSDKKVEEKDLENDPLKGINVEAAGGAGKVLKMIAEKSKKADSAVVQSKDGEEKEAVVAVKKKELKAYNASNFSNGQASASFTSTSLTPHLKNETAMFDEEEYMFDELTKLTKEKDRVQAKCYATMQTSLGTLNLELHADRAPKTVYNWVMLAKQGKYDDVIFHRLIPGFMIQGGDPTGTGRGGASYWGNTFRDEYDEKGAFKHDSRGVLAMANSGPGTNSSQFYITFRDTPHLNGKHTVFGKVIDGMETLAAMETQNINKANRPLKDIKILGVVIVQDPFEIYRARIAEKEARRDYSDEAVAARAAKKAKKENDRTTWLGTDLGAKGQKRQREEDAGGVGKYLAPKASTSSLAAEAPAAPSFGVESKKQKKLGSFGNFSGW